MARGGFDRPRGERITKEPEPKLLLPPAPAPAPAPAPVAASPGGTYPLEQLKTMHGTDGIDPSKKEQYLSDADFQATFKMSKSDFEKLAGWKQTKLKKDAGIF